MVKYMTDIKFVDSDGNTPITSNAEIVATADAVTEETYLTDSIAGASCFDMKFSLGEDDVIIRCNVDDFLEILKSINKRMPM